MAMENNFSDPSGNALEFKGFKLLAKLKKILMNDTATILNP